RRSASSKGPAGSLPRAEPRQIRIRRRRQQLLAREGAPALQGLDHQPDRWTGVRGGDDRGRERSLVDVAPPAVRQAVDAGDRDLRQAWVLGGGRLKGPPRA